MFPVRVSNISKQFESVQALNSISFEVNQGEVFGLIGPDGAGKTTLIRILTSLIIPDSGIALVLGYDTVKNYKEIRKRIGYMPGKFSLYSDLSVKENLEFFAGVFGTTIDENYYLIKDIYHMLKPFEDRLAGKLSGGMKQKLALSCALIHKPEILFLDEPTTGVDAVSRKEFWTMLTRLKEEKITIVVSTPYMDEASLCDKIALVNKGEVLGIDTPQGIIKKYPYLLFGISTKQPHNIIRQLQQVEGYKGAYLFGQEIHFSTDNSNCSVDYLKDIFNRNRINYHSVERIEASVEDCFMQLMGNAE